MKQNSRWEIQEVQGPTPKPHSSFQVQVKYEKHSRTEGT